MAQSVAPRSRADPPALPDWIRPQLTQLVKEAPDGKQWLEPGMHAEAVTFDFMPVEPVAGQEPHIAMEVMPSGRTPHNSPSR